jgi:hypothetical protein
MFYMTGAALSVDPGSHNLYRASIWTMPATTRSSWVSLPSACATPISRSGMDQCLSPPCSGTEGTGIVERVGIRVTEVRTGDHVVMTSLSCGPP